MHRADGSQAPVWLRRRDGQVRLLAEDQDLFDVAESLAAEADRLVTTAGDPRRAVVPAARVRQRLATLVPDSLTRPADRSSESRCPADGAGRAATLGHPGRGGVDAGSGLRQR